MTAPTIHSNGTAKQDLMDGLLKAHDAVGAALKLVAATMPNGRDYYTQGDWAFKAATDEHTARVLKLSQVKNELMAMAIHIDGGG